MTNARMTALKALIRVDVDKGYSSIVIGKEIVNSNLSLKDASFASALFYGVLERKLTLDHVISGYSKVPLKKIDNDILEILRIGLYQLLYMDKIPDSAAVNESVKLAKARKKFGAAGFVNGLLRSVIRDGKVVKISSNKNDLYEISVKYSCPIWILELWIKSYGKNDLFNMLDSLFGRPPLTVRVNTLKINTEELIGLLNNKDISVEKSDLVEDALILGSLGSIEKLEEFKKGYFHVQDLASQICCKVLGPKQGQTMLDICSAPGGKTFTSAQIMNNKGKILAFDLYDSKIKLINDGAKRLGISIVDAKVRDALSEDKIGDIRADRVLCDVPCSGLGIIRRKPEIRYKDKEIINNLPDLQYRILCNSSEFVLPGGILVYSTCTLNPAENNDIADRFLDENAGFEAYEFKNFININSVINEPRNQLTLMPHLNGTDGFFISAFRRLG